MTITQQQVDSFHQFATKQLCGADGECSLTWREMFDLWRHQNPTEAEQQEIRTALKQSEEDIANGRVRLAKEAINARRAKYDLVPRLG